MVNKFLVIAMIFVCSIAAAQFDQQEDKRTYKVVVNHEEQYSIWLADREIPLGWKAVGKSGTKQECLDYIEEVWTDMRPLSVRKETNPDAKPKKKPN